MATMQIPVTIPQDVTDYVANIGLRAEFEEILDKIPEMFSQMRRIECEFDPGVAGEEDPIVIVNTWIPNNEQTYPTPTDQWTDWTIHRFPGIILTHFVVLFWHEAA